jgi:hypothetical protein
MQARLSYIMGDLKQSAGGSPPGGARMVYRYGPDSGRTAESVCAIG